MAGGAVSRFTPKRRARFLEVLSEIGNVRDACEAIGLSREAAYYVRNRDADFKAAWEAAIEKAADKLEKEAWRRAHDGVPEPVFHKGQVCGAVKKYSDVLLIFLLKGIRPQKYRDHWSGELTGKDGGPVSQELTVRFIGAEDGRPKAPPAE